MPKWNATVLKHLGLSSSEEKGLCKMVIDGCGLLKERNNDTLISSN